jgi:F-type H+-transporting ATPase subunit a
MKAWHANLSIGKKLLFYTGLWLLFTVIIFIVFGTGERNEAFQPQEEFRLEAWVPITILGIDMSINKAVLYLFMASALTIGTLTWIARQMERRPNLTQTAMELSYNLVAEQIARGNLDSRRAARWFPFLATAFFWILFSNLIGLIPLPINTHDTMSIFGLEVPTLALYAATANISIPLALTIVVWVSYHVEGVAEHGPIKYLGTWLPAGLEDMNPLAKGAIWLIEAISHTVRLISLSVRLFANILAGHLLLLFMGGGLAILLGIAALGALTFPLAFAFFVFEIVIIAGLQAFIFSILTAIYIGGATAESH